MDRMQACGVCDAGSIPAGDTMEKDKKILGLQKNVFVLGLTSLFNDFSNEMILAIFPAFFTSVLKSGAASLGLVEGLADAMANFIKIYSGRISDKIQRRKIFAILGYSLSVAIRPFYILIGAIGGILGLRLIDRVGKGRREPARDALISLSVNKEELGRSFGYHRAMDSIGGILGPLVAFFILKSFPFGFNLVFISAFLVGLIAIFSLFFVKEVSAVARNGDFKLARLKDFSSRFKIYIFSVFILSAGSLPVAVLLLKTQDLGMIIAYIPLYYMVYNISFTIFSYLAGRAADKWGDSRVIILGYILLILGYMVLIYTNSAISLIFGFLLIGLFGALTDGIHRSYTANLTTPEHRSSAYGYLNGISGFGSLAAGIIGGYLWQYFNSSTALAASGLIVLLGLILFIATQTKKIISA